MTSAYLIAVFIVSAMIGLVTLPLAWWLIAYWQHRINLNKLSKASLYWSVTPIFSFVIMYLDAAKILVSPKVAVITFFLIPVVNFIALIVMMLLTVLQSKRKE